MIQNFDQTDRRILTFPAVHPCEAISPATLLNSLISLSQNIYNYQSKLFATQRKNARQTIRQISLLLLFFEETRDRRLALSDSAVLCFSELHLAFQKVQFLLEDCTREGAKLWILIKSQIVSTQFRALIRAIATALDVLPLSLIDVGGEVKELVELVGKQARNAKVEVDPEDEWALKQVFSILDHFEKGIEPDSSFIKRVLDHLEIRNWNDCNKEIKFLEEQIGFRCSDCNEREVPFLSSLLGLMSYCRGVIFETWNHRNNDKSDARHGIEAPSCINTEDFRCPISLELMTDPVTVSTGQTYDRSSIQRWLKAGNMTCPKTGERLTSTELVSNTTLRKLIQQFCTDVGNCASNSGSQSRDIARTISPGSPAAAEEMKFLSRFLARRLVFGSREQKTKAAYEIRLLAKSNIFNRSCLIEAGTILPLINLLSSSFEHYAQEIAISALLKLSKHTCGKKEIIESGGLQSILAVLQRGLSLEAKQMAAATIFYLASVKAYRKLIGETPEVVPTLVELIKDGTTSGKKNGVVAIFGLLLHSGNHQRVLASGTIPLLMDILSSSDNDELVADSVAVLAAIAESVDGTLAILQTSALSTIPRILQSSPSRAAREYCVTVLLTLCKNGGAEAIAILAKDHSLMSSLYSLLTDGTPHGISKARALIKTLHRFHETSSSGRIASVTPCERPVHAW
ncbi:PREDICTED: U-box domain-containing protein 19-like [Populus euphratica]|uniref:RING-type E3 ubiquitin transferase n=1 Tax=Populus euphratica TaxID=75702 RepID=A0AAJ6XRH2_POPEU|nr:PREDICTED: U-box domain-containing protein 19-like [Populus euphratica]